MPLVRTCSWQQLHTCEVTVSCNPGQLRCSTLEYQRGSSGSGRNKCIVLLQKSKKAALEADAGVADEPTGIVVPAVMVSPDVVILPAASVQAASADDQAGSGPGAQIQRTESGKAVVKGPTGARAFKRVNDDEWLGKKGAWDNSYEAKFGSSGWGAKASQTLLQVSHTWHSRLHWLLLAPPVLHLLYCAQFACGDWVSARYVQKAPVSQSSLVGATCYL